MKNAVGIENHSLYGDFLSPSYKIYEGWGEECKWNFYGMENGEGIPHHPTPLSSLTVIDIPISKDLNFGKIETTTLMAFGNKLAIRKASLLWMWKLITVVIPVFFLTFKSIYVFYFYPKKGKKKLIDST